MNITLKEIVGHFLNSKDSSTHEFRRLYNIGIFGLKTEFNLDITGVTKTVVIDVNANKTASLPEDYINYRKIGVLNNQGEVITFKRNDQLSNYHAEYTEAEDRIETAPVEDTVLASPFIYSNYWVNGVSYNLFGLDSGTANIGEYKIDERSKVILFNVDLEYSQIVLEYLSNCIEDEYEGYEVDIRAAQAMIWYLRWQNAVDLPKKFSQAVANDYMRKFYNQKRLAKQRINPVNIGEMQDVRRSLTKLVAKA